MSNPSRTSFFMAISSGDLDRDLLHDVVVVAGGVEDQLEGLRSALPVAGLRHDGVGALLLGLEARAPLSPRITAEVGPELRLAPHFPAVGRHFHASDSVAAVPRETLH